MIMMIILIIIIVKLARARWTERGDDDDRARSEKRGFGKLLLLFCCARWAEGGTRGNSSIFSLDSFIFPPPIHPFSSAPLSSTRPAGFRPSKAKKYLIQTKLEARVDSRRLPPDDLAISFGLFPSLSFPLSLFLVSLFFCLFFFLSLVA